MIGSTLFPETAMSDLAGDVFTGIQQDSGCPKLYVDCEMSLFSWGVRQNQMLDFKSELCDNLQKVHHF
jgi:hypothetical protein